MSGHQHHDPIEDNIETHPVKLATSIAIGAVALVVGIVLMVQLAVGFYGSRSMKDEAAMSEAAVAKRLAPVAKLAVDPNAPKAAPAAPAAAPVAPAAIPPAPAAGAGGADAGKATYDATCAACHATGVAGAPKAGDKAAWAARLKEGKPHLYEHAIKGKGAMPPKGGNTSLSDDAVKAAVDYLVATAK
jgi:cytochrome c5